MDRRYSTAGILGLACAMSGFVVSLAYVPAANTLCELAAAPFFAAIFERLLLKQNVSKITMICMLMSFLGLVLFALEGVFEDSAAGSSGKLNEDDYDYVLGNTLGIISSIGIAIYTVALRAVPLEQAGGIYGIVISAFSAFTVMCGATVGFAIDSILAGSVYSYSIDNKNINTTSISTNTNTTTTTTTTTTTSHRMNPFDMPPINVWLSVGHAVFIFTGFIFYTQGSSHLPAPETVLLSMLEVVGGVLLTYIFVGEYPGTWGIIGTVLTTVAVLTNGIGNGWIQKKVEERVEKVEKVEKVGGCGGSSSKSVLYIESTTI